MHIPGKFKQDNGAELEGVIRSYPFATLVTYSGSGITANHLPMVLAQVNGKKVLQAHIARANPLWKALSDPSEVLVIFNGPHCYISPNHYPTKQQTGRAVPTWNYVVVHVTGVMRYVQDENWLRAFIDSLTTEHEASQPVPWSTSDAPQGYIQKMLPAIVGLEIDITSMTGQWKLSQNQPEQNRLGVIAGLSSEHDSQYQHVAALVKAQMAAD